MRIERVALNWQGAGSGPNPWRSASTGRFVAADTAVASFIAPCESDIDDAGGRIDRNVDGG